MIDIEYILFALFIAFLIIFLLLKRKKVEIQKIIFPIFYVIVYRTKLGLSAMDKYSKKYNKTFKWLGYIGIGIGFIGMALMVYSLVENLISLITSPKAAAGVGLVLPVKGKGIFYVPFTYWIISIFLIAVVHEFAHGVIAKTHKMKVKSSGFAFFSILAPIVPAAFVEPDEKEIGKRPVKEQLSVFAAGSFSNILLGFFALLMIYLIAPGVNSITEVKGVEVTGFIESENPLPAQAANMSIGEIIVSVDGQKIEEFSNFTNILLSHKPGDTIQIETNKKNYSIVLAQNPTNTTMPYLGVYTGGTEKVAIKDSFNKTFGTYTGKFILWFLQLLFFIVTLSIGIGLFNLLPALPADGGRMIYVILKKYFDEKKAAKIIGFISLLFLIIILAIFYFIFFK